VQQETAKLTEIQSDDLCHRTMRRKRNWSI